MTFSIAGTMIGLMMMTAMVFCFYMLFRNEKVAKLRKFINQRVYDIAVANVDKGIITEDPWHEYNQVSYDKMMRQFWKPVKPESFWDDVSFLLMPEDEVTK